MGCEASGKGAVLLFDVQTNALIHRWNHEKALLLRPMNTSYEYVL